MPQGLLSRPRTLTLACCRMGYEQSLFLFPRGGDLSARRSNSHGSGWRRRVRSFLVFRCLVFGGWAPQPALAQTGAQSVSPADQFAHAQQDIKQGHLPEAIATLEKLNQITPAIKDVAHDLGLACYRSGKLVDARQAFNKAIQDDPSDMESIQMLGLTLYRLGEPSAAIPYLERVRQWMPHSDAD